ncbi:hypothetical protein JHK87_020389 [Glycine soja]|nr:hypothetical protein JHK87_020389 [Glycine soja]
MACFSAIHILVTFQTNPDLSTAPTLWDCDVSKDFLSIMVDSLILTVEEFKHSVNIYTLWKPGMDINVSHMKRRNIPTFVTWEIKPSSELRVSDHSQAEKSQEGKMVVFGANGDRKRKQAEDSVNCTDSEINSTSEKPDLKSSVEFPGDRETNGSVTSNLQVTSTDASSSKEAKKLAIEKIMCGPYDAQRVFSKEPDELEDDLEFRNQVKDFGGKMKNSNLDSSYSEIAVATEPIIPKKETTSATRLYSNGGSEELEVNLLIYHKYRASAIILQQSYIIDTGFSLLLCLSA